MARLQDLFETYENNPYSENFQYQKKGVLKKISNTDYQVVKGEKRVKDINIVLAKETIYDKEPFVKLFNKNLDLLKKLRIGEFKVFLYILYRLEYNNGTAYVSNGECLKWLGEKPSYAAVVTRAVKQLLHYNIIKLHAQPERFWVNPNIIYKGDRKFVHLS